MIDQPGLYSMSADEYHRDPVVQPSLSASIANLILSKSPAHARMAHPRLFAGFEREDDSRFELGSAAHALLLEGDSSAIEFIPFDDWRKNDAKAMRDEARANGKLPVLTKYEGVLRQMVKVAEAAMAQSEFADVWRASKPEQVVVWKEANGAWCRCRPDKMTDDRSIVFDYKTSESAEPSFFIRQIPRLGYDLAAAFYMRGTGAQHYVWLAQELEPPFACSLVALGNAYREMADERCDTAIRMWGDCLKADKWPAYDLRVHYAEPSSWQMAEYEARMNRAA